MVARILDFDWFFDALKRVQPLLDVGTILLIIAWLLFMVPILFILCTEWALKLFAQLISLLHLPYELTRRVDSANVIERTFIFVGTIVTVIGIVLTTFTTW